MDLPLQLPHYTREGKTLYRPSHRRQTPEYPQEIKSLKCEEYTYTSHLSLLSGILENSSVYTACKRYAFTLTWSHDMQIKAGLIYRAVAMQGESSF